MSATIALADKVSMDAEHLIDGERAYPIWFLEAKWVEDGMHDPKCPWMGKGLPEGRIHNGTSIYKMYREDRTEAAVRDWAWQWTRGFKAVQDQSASDLKIAIKFKWYETWCIKWFNHYTFDLGQTDEETRLSFSRFVMRMEVLNERGRYVDGLDRDVYCLMGAEDRGRWKGPCRCEHCKKLKVLHMDH